MNSYILLICLFFFQIDWCIFAALSRGLSDPGVRIPNPHLPPWPILGYNLFTVFLGLCWSTISAISTTLIRQIGSPEHGFPVLEEHFQTWKPSIFRFHDVVFFGGVQCIYSICKLFLLASVNGSVLGVVAALLCIFSYIFIYFQIYTNPVKVVSRPQARLSCLLPPKHSGTWRRSLSPPHASMSALYLHHPSPSMY